MEEENDGAVTEQPGVKIIKLFMAVIHEFW
jgi:hypothetical protein